MSLYRSTVMFVCVLVVAALSAVLATMYYFRPLTPAVAGPGGEDPKPAVAPPPLIVQNAPAEAREAIPGPSPTKAPEPTPAFGDVVTVARKIRHAVVLVQSLDASGGIRATGTGFFVSADGKFVTNAHVVQGGKSFRIRRDDGSTVAVSGTLAFQRDTDLAVLKAVCTGVPFLALDRNHPAEPGEKVVVIGSPLGLEGTVSDGIVSAMRTVEGDQFIQITAPLSPGSSGSPVVDLQGRLIGVATMASFGRAQSLNFAVPEKYVRAILEKAGQGKAFVEATSRPTRPTTPPPSGLSAKDIVIRLQAGFTSGEVAAEVKQKGTTGAFPAEQLARIREVGGREDLLVLCKPPATAAAASPEASGTEEERSRAASGIDSKWAQSQAQWNFFRRETEANMALQLQRVRSALATGRNANLRNDMMSELERLERQIQQLIKEVSASYEGGASRLEVESLRTRLEPEIRKLYQRFVALSGIVL